MRWRGVVAVAIGLGLLGAPPASAAAGDTRAEPTVTARKVIGHSVRGRPIRAYRLGQPGHRRVLLIATMHGDEARPRQILRALVEGPPVRDLTLWVVPTYNPDGLARRTRQNARGVDLNRNYPYRWVDLDGPTESGPRPASEPETRAMMGFLRATRPARILSFHQPLFGVDTDTKRPGFARRVSRALDLPAKRFDCGGVCHGTMTGWYNRRFAGAALTVEYGARPTRWRLRVQAPRAVVRVLGGRLGAA